MIPVFLITCAYTKARHEYVKSHLKNVLDYQVIFAPDYRLLEANPDILRRNISLSIAYIQTLHTALFNGNPTAILIMEDDIHFQPYSFALIEGLIRELPSDFDLCYLTKTSPANDGAKTKVYSSGLEKIVSNWWETPLTLWSRKFAVEFLAYAEWKISNGLIGNIDHELNKLNEGISEWPKARTYNYYGSKLTTAYGLSTKEDGMVSLI